MTLFYRHPAGKPRTLASIPALLVVALSLGACETPNFGRFVGSGETRAERLAANGQHDDAASQYIYLATNSMEPAERDRLTLLAVEQWLDAGDTTRARNAYSDVAEQKAGRLHPLWNTNAAAFALYRGDADVALNILEPLSRESLSLRDRLRVEALRADAWIQKRDPSRAVELMTQRESWVDSRRGVTRNRQRLWQGLLVSDPKVLQAAAENATDPQIRKWLTLALLAVSTGQQGNGWSAGVERWREENFDHPAMTVLDGMDIPIFEALDYPRRIALMLPLTGQSAAAGKAIQNGFLSAYFTTAHALDEQQTLRIYDVNTQGGASAAYDTAIRDGAEFVVGPLLKNNVTELANNTLVPVPILTLNYLTDGTLAPPGLFQFALAPEDEAASAAVRALSDGHTRAVALVPNNDWGRRVLQSFATELEGLGGTLLDYRRYTPDKRDFSNEIENLMGLTGSVQRYQRMRANIGGALQFDPRRRQDVDFIFLATGAASGRLLKSQLKFHYSGNLPTYSTSLVNSMDGRSNSDLNGVMFADVPWLINPQPWIRDLPSAFARYWPTERRLGRLHAMGHDSYNLIASLYASRGSEMSELNGATGKLFLDQYGRVHRRLPWAQFQQGEAIALAEPDVIGGPIQDVTDDRELMLPNIADEPPWTLEPQEQ